MIVDMGQDFTLEEFQAAVKNSGRENLTDPYARASDAGVLDMAVLTSPEFQSMVRKIENRSDLTNEQKNERIHELVEAARAGSHWRALETDSLEEKKADQLENAQQKLQEQKEYDDLVNLIKSAKIPRPVKVHAGLNMETAIEYAPFVGIGIGLWRLFFA